ncbi:hypothetical protein C7S20_08975 [Christiangramia fulva]|uniref:Uncharacterized protein n=1 Tax=Christiangramia fulva TaxID=2126553 RepID=A0A2R3Z5A7_9FLAO|nr:DUF6090 family protein [Christiangramia fulva]AVR45392.1 hypothetical protein C7S20_08975 [Christiangramia fulva]
MKQNKVKSYLLYAIGEIILVVIGILIALQVNNWNEKRKQDQRFMFGLRELYGEIKSTAYYESALKDKLTFQLIRIDSVLNKSEEIPLRRLPAMIQLFDQYGLDVKDNTWKAEYLEFVPGDDKRNQMARALRSIAFGWNDIEDRIKAINMNNVMVFHLREYNVPIQIYYAGTGYEEFIKKGSENEYTPQQLSQVRTLVKAPSFIADLMTIKSIKENILNYTSTVGFSAESFLNYVEQYDPKTDYSLPKMEIIGTGLPNGQWASGLEMKRVNPENENIWEIDQELVDGVIKFRADDEWLLDWGKGESDPKSLVFKGGDIPVKKGNYHIQIDIEKNTMEFTPLKN